MPPTRVSVLPSAISLPKPQLRGGLPLLSALCHRRSVRAFYVAMTDGAWLYDPSAHALLPWITSDIRIDTGTQDFVANAPIELIYVAHGERMDVPPEERRLYASVDAAFIGENVYLFCASEGLGTVFRGSFDRAKLANLLRLGDGQFVTFVQTVGYPRC